MQNACKWKFFQKQTSLLWMERYILYHWYPEHELRGPGF